MAKTIAEMQHGVYVNNIKHGWFDKPRTFGDDVALLHEEVSEMFHAFRKGHIFSEVTKDDFSNEYDPSSLHAEAADILIRLLDTCERYDIDLETEFDRKMEFNRNRPYRHGNKTV